MYRVLLAAPLFSPRLPISEVLFQGSLKDQKDTTLISRVTHFRSNLRKLGLRGSPMVGYTKVMSEAWMPGIDLSPGLRFSPDCTCPQGTRGCIYSRRHEKAKSKDTENPIYLE